MIAFSAVRRLRGPAQARPRRQRPAERAAAARRDDRRVRRRHGPEGQERLVLDDLPAAARPAHLRPDAARAGRQRALPAVRRLRQELLRLQPARRLPGRPPRQRQLLERLPALLRRRVPGPRARLLRHRRRATSLRDGALRRGQHRRLRARSPRSSRSRRTRSRACSARSRSASSTGTSPTSSSSPLTWPLRAAAIALAATWFVRTLRKEKPFLEQAAAPIAGAGDGVAAPPRSRTNRARQERRARGHVRPREQARRRQAGPVAAGDRRGQRHADRGRLPDGHLRRRPGGDQGRDGVHVRRSPTTSRPRSSGSASRRTRGWRAACASPARSPSRSRPTRPRRRSISQVADFNYDKPSSSASS